MSMSNFSQKAVWALWNTQFLDLMIETKQKTKWTSKISNLNEKMCSQVTNDIHLLS